MSAEVHFLNVAWGDSHAIRLPSGKVTLIDGGDGAVLPNRDHPLRWLDRHGVEEIEWLILTHLHEDHLNGLLAVAEAKSIRNAVLPYEPFRLPAAEDEAAYVPLAGQMLHMLGAYLTLIERLREQGTAIRWRDGYGSREKAVVWEEEGVRFAHLYPWLGDPLPAYQMIRDMAEAGLPPTNDALLSFFEASNHDSSVYRLSLVDEPEHDIVFGGDQPEPGWERMATRDDIACGVLKAAHHGLPDGFNERILALTRPEHCVIPIEAARSGPYAAEWKRLSKHAQTTIRLTSGAAHGLTYRLGSGAAPAAAIESDSEPDA
ncbi:ComEC/Rec2 family competence protein [Paenibacillus glycinis]|uniref:MBL fold metallo-hydrolase n=1 Tax=Paenibacillus glycinis TaxID=2697035 RepID=A0ABW9XKY9_9BACL|nr:MBL fold metallo-hydrolase [Paenibacillus glycinis]NBD23299.1 MBL fold metallo-hydrolase [Paenibacillus glycinis]